MITPNQKPLLGALFLSLMVFLAAAQVPRIALQSQGHTGRIPSLAFTPDGTRLVSISEDKTIKIWQVGSGALLKTLESEIGDGFEGMLYASAMAPSGKWLAVAGYQVRSQQENYIVLIDLEKGTQAATARGHSDIINTLAVNGKGDLLASGSQDGTIRIWKTNAFPDISLHAVLKTNGPVMNLAFNPMNDDLAVIGETRDISVYPVARIPAGESAPAPRMLRRHKEQVSKIAYAPDGSSLVSASLGGEVMLWNNQGSPTELMRGKLAITALTWAPDSRMLAILDEQGTGLSITIPANTVLTEHRFHDNVVFSAAFAPGTSGTYMVASAGGTNHEIVFWNPVNGNVVRRIKGKGNTIGQLGFGKGSELFISNSTEGGKPRYRASFDFSTLQIDKKATGAPAPKTPSNSIYQTSEQTIVFGKNKTIQTNPQEDGRIFDFIQLKDGSVIVASEFSLKQFTPEGNYMREFTGHQSTVRSITVSGDGRYLASGGDDQIINLWLLSETGSALTLRQYFDNEEWAKYFSTLPVDSLTRIPNKAAWQKMIVFLKGRGEKSAREVEAAFRNLGEQVLPFVSLFITDDQEWVCWSPEGYYASSTEGAGLFGWHVNKGIDQLADFYEASQFFEILYRPREVRNSLVEGRRIEAMLRAQGVPVFDLTHLFRPSIAYFEDYLVTDLRSKISNVNGSLYTAEQSLPMEVKIFDGGGGVRELSIYRNDKLILRDTTIAFRPGTNEVRKVYDLPLGNRENVFSIKTINRSRVESKPEEFTVNYSGKAIATSNLFILSVGINSYMNSNYDLNYARPDAEAFTRKMVEVNSNIYRNIVRKEIYDREATRANILKELNHIAATCTAEDVFIFYYAGHGVVGDEVDAEFFLVPTDVVKMFDTQERLRERGISASQLKDAFIRIRAQKQVVMMDACHSGAAVTTLKFRAAPTEEKAINTLARSSGVAILASSGTKQFAAEFEQLKHGTFTYALLEGLSGNADQGDGQVTVNELVNFMYDRVPELTEQYGGKAQYPNCNTTGNDFPIGTVPRK